ncbi:MAG: cytochrome c [Opitutaceae bacterium]|nr:cytochrome c [Opitutaceae bacterium]
MRERIAILVCWLTLGLVVGLSWLFALRHNPVAPPPAPSVSVAAPGPEARPPGTNEAGARLFREQGCTSCHALGGNGNPRYPLDGVGARLKPDELRAWITGTGPAAGTLSAMVVRRKARYLELSDADLAALVAWLGEARAPAP